MRYGPSQSSNIISKLYIYGINQDVVLWIEAFLI